MTLTGRLLALCQQLAGCFPQHRTLERATSILLAALLCCGRKWVTRMNCVRGREHVDWSGDYRLFSRSPWLAADLFVPVIGATLPYFGDGPIVLAGDETRARRGGRKVKRSRWTRDPLSPPFHVNFMKGIRFMQFSALLPLGQHNVDARGLPVSFEPVDRPPKPGKKATEQEKAEYGRLCKEQSMGKQAWQQLEALRDKYDQAGAKDKLMIVGLDGGFCNRSCFRPTHERIVLVARTRKDAVLCRPVPDTRKSGRVYSKETFTPEGVRQDEAIPWQTTPVFFGGQLREVRYKQVGPVLWRTGARRKPLRLIVVAPVPYQLSPGLRKYYREPAYLLVSEATDRVTIPQALQAYFDRWQIEVNHRDEKQHIGVVDAQVWNDRSVDRLPTFMVAAYAFLLMASLQAFGPARTHDYLQPPRWQKRPRRRPSCLDLLTKLREEARDNPERYEPLGFTPDLERILFRAA